MTLHLPSLRRGLPGALTALAAVLLVMFAPGPGAAVTVQPGETLSAIAARHGVSVPALAAANGITDPNRVVAGVRLRLPGGSAPAPSSSGGHTVAPGETLSAIAARYGVSVAALARANGIRDTHMVVAGRRLAVPGGAAPGAGGGAAVAAGGVHVVRSGDTLDTIAVRHGTSAAALAAANGIRDPNRIRAGQRLRVPAAPGGAGAGSGPGAYVGARTVSRDQVRLLIDGAAARHGVDPALARAIAFQESGFNHNVRSHVGAVGAMQLMPATAAWVGPSLVGRRLDPANLRDNVDGGVAYLAWLMRRTGDPRQAAAAYYQGLNALRSRGMFDDTKAYVRAVFAHYGRV